MRKEEELTMSQSQLLPKTQFQLQQSHEQALRDNKKLEPSHSEVQAPNESNKNLA